MAHGSHLQTDWGLLVQAAMKEPLRSLVQLPVDAEGLAARLPEQLRPPGL